MKKEERYFTGSTLANFLIIVIPPFPAIIVYTIVDLFTSGTLNLWLPVLLAFIALFAFFPFTWKIVEIIREMEGE